MYIVAFSVAGLCFTTLVLMTLFDIPSYSASTVLGIIGILSTLAGIALFFLHDPEE